MNVLQVDQKQVLFTPSKSKLAVLRMASGLDTKGMGIVSRNYLVIPANFENAMLSVAQRLVKDGMMKEARVPAPAGQPDPKDTTFILTEKGQAEAQPKGMRRYSVVPAESGEENPDDFRKGAVYNFTQAIDLIVEGRALLHEGLSDYPTYRHEQAEKLGACLRVIGELCYELGQFKHHPKGKRDKPVKARRQAHITD